MMTTKTNSKLSSIFKAYDIRAIYPDPLDETAAWKVGHAAGQFLGQLAKDASGDDAASLKLPRTVAVSRDMRPHSPSLAGELIEGLRCAGMNVIDLGQCDTSFIYFAVNYLGCAGGIQTTASHNPIQYNGFKISGIQAKPIGAQTGLKTIQQIAETLPGPGDTPMTGKVEKRDLWDEYRQHVLSFYRAGGRKLKVFVDASNGMAGKMVPRLFDGVDGLEIIPLNFEITGSFVHEPNPLVAENMKPTQDGVIQHGADLGVCFDGDADRCILTDEKGDIIGCDHLTALLTGDFLKDSPGATIVYDLRSSKAVEEAILLQGGQPRRGRVGHVFMKAILRETDGVFGGELSGHFYFRDNFYTDSGAITFAAIASVLSQSDRPISELIAPYRKYPQSGEINYQVDDKTQVIQALKQKYANQADVDELDGISMDAWDRPDGGWWFNIRPSNTEPLLRLNAEAKEPTILDRLITDLQAVIGAEPHQEH